MSEPKKVRITAGRIAHHAYGTIERDTIVSSEDIDEETIDDWLERGIATEDLEGGEEQTIPGPSDSMQPPESNEEEIRQAISELEEEVDEEMDMGSDEEPEEGAEEPAEEDETEEGEYPDWVHIKDDGEPCGLCVSNYEDGEEEPCHHHG